MSDILDFVKECRKSMEITNDLTDTTTHRDGTHCEPKIIAIDFALLQACDYLEETLTG